VKPVVEELLPLRVLQPCLPWSSQTHTLPVVTVIRQSF
jgi:hypothetical protein